MNEYKNNSKNAIKVEVEKTKPKIWQTVRPGKTIKTEAYGNYYLKSGLDLVGKKKEEKKEEKIEIPHDGPVEVKEEKPLTASEKRKAARKAREEAKKKEKE